jgi:hypothetical protein
MNKTANVFRFRVVLRFAKYFRYATIKLQKKQGGIVKTTLIALILLIGSTCYAQDHNSATPLPPLPYYKITCTAPAATYYNQNVFPYGSWLLVGLPIGEFGGLPLLILPAPNCRAVLITQ